MANVTALGRVIKAARNFSATVDSLGRVQRRIDGRQVSKSIYLREKRRGPGGKFGSKKSHIGSLPKSGLAQQVMDELGPPIGGGDWQLRVLKSGERFRDMLTG